MNRFGPIAEFLSSLRTELNRRAQPTESIIAEVEDHLMEAAHRLRLSGIPREEAEREAIRRFGTSEEIAQCFGAELEKEKVMQPAIASRPTGVRVLAIFVLVCAGLQSVTALNLALQEKVMAAALAFGQSTLSWFIGFGLWKLRNWSRVATLIWMGLSIAGGSPTDGISLNFDLSGDHAS